MATAYTSLLGLALPVTGELQGTWGTTVNDSITSLLDTAVAGTTTLSSDADVTLSTTTGAANQARQAILLCSGARTALRTITAPAQSKIYTVINATTGGFSVKLVGAGPTTGLTIPNGASAVVAWNGSDFVEVGSGTIGNLTVNGNLSVTGNTTLGDAAGDTTTVSGPMTLSAGTANGVLYLNGSKVATSGSALTFDGQTLTNTRDTPILNLNDTAASNVALRLLSTGGITYIQSGISAGAFAPIAFTANGGGSEQMRLTSTGLGIGTNSPGGKLEVYSGASGATAFSNGTNLIIQNNAAVGMSLLSPDANAARIYFGTASNNRNAFIYSDYNSGAQTLIFGVGTSTTAATEKMRLDSPGNLGLGVTPSAWETSFGVKAFEISNGAVMGATNDFYILHNAILETGGWKYKTTDFATRYQQVDGAHRWYTAPSGTAGNAISFTQAMTLDSSGRLLVGTTSAAGNAGLQVKGASSGYGRFDGTSSVLFAGDAGSLISGAAAADSAIRAEGALLFASGGGTERARITSGGNLLVGLTSSDAKFHVTNGASPASRLIVGGGGGAAGTLYSILSAGDYVGFETNGSERARITSGGDLWVGTTTAISPGALTANNVLSAGTSSQWAAAVRNSTATTPWGLAIQYSGASPNGTSSTFLFCEDSTTTRATIRSNGGIANYQANDVNLSDRREKTNFAPAKSYLDTICAIPVQTFNYIDQSEDDPGLTLGVVAQDVQAVAPELVMESNWGTEDNPKMRLSIYQTDLQYALMKCIQEQQALISALTARVAALEAA